MSKIERLEAEIAKATDNPYLANDDKFITVRASDVRALIAAYREARAQAEGMAEFAALKMEERDAAEAKLKALREAAGALDKALKEEGAETCDICGCGTLATRYLGWQLDGEVLCEEHAEEERNDPNNGEPLEDRDLAIAAPLRALRAALEAKP